jgi:hypothetical protein
MRPISSNGPFAIVVSAAARLAEMMLFKMFHLMRQRRQGRPRTALEVFYIERDLVQLVRRTVGSAKALEAEVAIGATMWPHRDQARRQAPAKQSLVEILVGRIKPVIDAFGRGLRHGVCSLVLCRTKQVHCDARRDRRG